MEATVMSGTPVLSTIRDGLAGARPLALRGILNGTANYTLTLMAQGREYAAALADAQAQGYAEPDPTDDVEGHDVVAKIRILAAMAFGQAVALDQVLRRGSPTLATRPPSEPRASTLESSSWPRSDHGRISGAMKACLPSSCASNRWRFPSRTRRPVSMG
jgi:homoserine dehydrogenase